MTDFPYEMIFDEKPQPASTQPTTTEAPEDAFEQYFDERKKLEASLDTRDLNLAPIAKMASGRNQPLAKSAHTDTQGRGARVERKKNASGETWIFEYGSDGSLISGRIEP